MDKLEITHFEQLNQLEKNIAIVNLYIKNELVGIGTIGEIAEKLGRTKKSIYVGLSRTRSGEAKLKPYRIELVEYVPYRKKEYELLQVHVKTGEFETLGIGDIEYLSKVSGYSEAYLRILASETSRENVYKRRRTDRRGCFEVMLVEVLEGDDGE